MPWHGDCTGCLQGKRNLTEMGWGSYLKQDSEMPAPRGCWRQRRHRMQWLRQAQGAVIESPMQQILDSTLLCAIPWLGTRSRELVFFFTLCAAHRHSVEFSLQGESSTRRWRWERKERIRSVPKCCKHPASPGTNLIHGVTMCVVGAWL